MTKPVRIAPYVSAWPRALAIQILVGLQLALIAVRAVDWGFAAFASDSELFGSVDRLVVLSGRSQQFLYWAAMIVFLTWVHRSIANLPALGSMSREFTPSSAVVSFFIPIANIVRGYQVVATIWRESQPAVLEEGGVPRKRTATLVKWWWGLYAAQVVGGVVEGELSLTHQQQTLNFVEIGLHILLLALGAMFLAVITATQRRQDAMWDDLERQRNVPRPSADYLR